MVNLQFFPVEVDYKIMNSKPYIRIYGRRTTGERVCVIKEVEPYFYCTEELNIKAQEEGRPVVVTKTEIIEKKVNGKQKKLYRCYVKFPRDIAILSSKTDKEVYEHDIDFTQKYMVDNKIFPLLLTEAQGDFINQRSRVDVFEAETINPSSTDVIPDLDVLAVDLEVYNPDGKNVDSKTHPIVMISFYGRDFKKVFVTKQFESQHEYVECLQSERELIKLAEEVINKYKPDVLVGYFSDGFDLPYLKERAEILNMDFRVGLDYSNMQIDKRGKSKAQITGISHIDIYRFIRRVFSTTLESSRYTLDNVSKEILGAEKIDVDIGKLAEAYDSADLDDFCSYNLRDSELTYRLFQDLKPNIVELVKVVGATPFDISRMGFSQLVEVYLMKRAAFSGLIIPPKPTSSQIRKRRKETYEGGFVYKPEPGLYENIMVFDFRSLYPSIITSHNISPETLNCECCEGEDQVPQEPYWFCQKKKGFISAIIENLISRRSRIKEIIRDKGKSKVLHARQYALKTVANAMYGYLGFFMARWYCMECAKSITSYGRYYIRQLIDKAQEEGFRTIYGDTDSVFLELTKTQPEEAKAFADKINLDLPDQMEVEFQGFYPRGIFVSAKVGRYGAKKKYALIDQNNKMNVKGFETVRRNISPIAKKTQEKVLRIILAEGDVEKALKFTQDVLQKVKRREFPKQDFIVNTQLTKNISEYESIGPHVAVAKELERKGVKIIPGMIISYIICGVGDRISDRARIPEDCESYDADYYIDHQIVPTVESIFEVVGYTKEEIVASPDQQKLDTFFG